MKDDPRALIQAWLKKADNDLKNAELILAAQDEDLPFDTVCFHCQQAAEKYLKAFLVNCDTSFPFSHNLADLVELCKQSDITFSSIQRKAEELTPYAVALRYPDDFYLPSKEEAREALAIAKEVREFILTRIDSNAKGNAEDKG
ncbi:MAG TPA: HEPN domain-containing protein [Bacillota bacterium]|nr:HEPN domain-containing protein [Bacillota bacterium]